MRLSLVSFDDPCIALIIKGGRRVSSTKIKNRYPITKNILKKITEDEPFSVKELKVDIVFKMAWAGFMRIGELTYTVTKAKNANFAKTIFNRSNISFAERD